MTIYIVEKFWGVEYGVDSACYAFETKQEAMKFAASFDFEGLAVTSRSVEQYDDDTVVYTYNFDPDEVCYPHTSELTFTISPYELGSGEQAHGAMYFE